MGEGFQVVTLDSVVGEIDIFITTTRSTWPAWRASLASRSRTSSRRSTALCSRMGTGSWSFTNQVLAQLDLLKNVKENKGYKNDVYLLPKELDEKVASLHLPFLGAKLTKLSTKQADYIGVKLDGPFKGDHYRY